jgi:hypothetical protein
MHSDISALSEIRTHDSSVKQANRVRTLDHASSIKFVYNISALWIFKIFPSFKMVASSEISNSSRCSSVSIVIKLRDGRPGFDFLLDLW